MYTTYFGFRDEPFSLIPAPQFFYTNAVYEEAYQKLLEGIRGRRGFMVLTGEVGAGKTTLLRRLMDTLAEDPAIQTVFSYYSTLSFADLVSFICHDLGLLMNEAGDRQDVQVLSEFLSARAQAGKITALLMDEAQDLGEDVLEQLFTFVEKQRTPEPLLQVLFVGQQPELDDKLNHPRLRRFKPTVTLRCQLTHLGTHEVAAFIHHRLHLVGYERQELFSSGALSLITRYSQGIPRLINLLCDNALRATQAASQATVSAATLQKVAKTLRLTEEPEVHLEETQELTKTPPEARPARARLSRAFMWSGGLALVALLIGLVVFVVREQEGKHIQKEDPTRTLQQLPGQGIFARLAARHPDVRPIVWGLATETPALALLLPEREWREFSQEEQVALTLYVESLIPMVRANPDSYLEEFRTTPMYEIFRQKVANLCEDCWVIGAGELTQESANVLFKQILVQGDSLWSRSLARNQGVKASEFRAAR